MNSEIFQKVFDILHNVLPLDWKKLVLYVGYSAGSYSMKYYISDENGSYTDCFKQTGISRTQLIKTFMAIDKELSAERKTLDEKNRWNVLSLIVEADGRMKAEYDYVDISENSIEYEQMWKEKYLKNSQGQTP